MSWVAQTKGFEYKGGAQLNFRLPPAMKRELWSQAHREETTLNELVVRVLARYLDQQARKRAA